MENEIPSSENARLWAASGVDVGLSNIERIQQSLIRSAELFRNESPEGAPFFKRCLEGMSRFLETIMNTRRLLNLDFQRISIEGVPLSEIETQSNEILRSISTCQEKEDYDSIADKVEYELLPNLCSWSVALKQVRSMLAATT